MSREVLSDAQFASTANSPAWPGATEGGATRNVHTGQAVHLGPGGTPGYIVSKQSGHEVTSKGPVQAAGAGMHRSFMRSDPQVARDPEAHQGVWHQGIGTDQETHTYDYSTRVMDGRKAMKTAYHEHQDAIFHPQTTRTIYTMQGIGKEMMKPHGGVAGHSMNRYSEYITR